MTVNLRDMSQQKVLKLEARKHESYGEDAAYESLSGCLTLEVKGWQRCFEIIDLFYLTAYDFKDT